FIFWDNEANFLEELAT
nr:glutathione transferase (EC 2.5.1.18) - European toad (fragments) [Bufo bufo]